MPRTRRTSPADAMTGPSSVTELLQQSRRGEPQALQHLYARLYPEIKRVARARLAHSGGIAGLDTTALVHEGFLRLAEQEGLQGESRGQFFAFVGCVLRSVVIDHLRSQGSDKRGGRQLLVTLSAAADVPAPQPSATDLLATDRALRRMAELDPPLYELLEMQAFAGLSVTEVAELRAVSSRTVQRDLIKARGLLKRLLDES